MDRYSLKSTASNRRDQTICTSPVQAPEKTLQVMQQEKINSLVGVPVQVLSLLRADQRLQFSDFSLKSALLSTDHVPDTLVWQLHQQWGCDVYNHYGMTEMGLGGGVECAAHQGYHLREADLLFEVLDLNTGQVVEDGQWGEVVFTTLTRTGMPLLRYRTGDISRFLLQPCFCGTSLRLLDKIRCRKENLIQLKVGFFSMSDLEEALFDIFEVENFSAVLENKSGLLVLTLTIEAHKITGRALHERIWIALRLNPVLNQAVEEKELLVQIQEGCFLKGSMKKRLLNANLE